jgi:predicted AAA+ superfamily ATPase
MIARLLVPALLELQQYYPITYLGGPRQSGKTTLLRQLFPQLPYASLEDPDTRQLAEQDPRRFLNAFPAGSVLDEAQQVPHLFSYLQGRVDENRQLRYVLSGSQNFLLMEKITQSLAGRVGILNLLPLSLAEINTTEFAPASLEEFAWRGGYPALFDRRTPPDIFFNNYIQTYLERDVRSLKNVGDLSLFNRFLRLCAGRAGQPLNLSALATDTGVAVNTAKAWLSILEASYLIFYLSPYFKNFNKRIIKSPKFYFFDTGLLCHLLGIASPAQLETHHYLGNIVENAIIAELYKKRTNAGKRPVFWYWQDQHGHEVDLLIEENGRLQAVEIKSSQTFNPRLMSGLANWQALTGNPAENHVLIYAGEQAMERESGTLMPWRMAVERV